MQQTCADAVFILGDLFEVWVGDDALQERQPHGQTFEAQCSEVLKQASKRLNLHFMHGNRDFLVGQEFAQSACLELLPDPCLIDFHGERWVLSHGDAMCLADHEYQLFRKTVRGEQWQSNFLAKPLSERRSIARALREQSHAHKLAASEYADVDTLAATHVLQSANAKHLIHGHTHRPADHVLSSGLHRHVLSDWDLGAAPARAQVFRLTIAANAPVAISRRDPSQA